MFQFWKHWNEDEYGESHKKLLKIEKMTRLHAGTPGETINSLGPITKA
jgi:hypothetical protein